MDNIKTHRSRLSRDSNYFENIDNRDKAYWLGVMFSDGCVCQRSNGSYSVSLEMVDREHIEKFILAINAVNHKIIEVRHKNFQNAKLSYSVHIYDKKMATDLIKLGCVPRKSLNLSSIPNIPHEFIYDFIRGFVDGDGCICYDKHRDIYVFKLIGSSPLFLQNIMKILDIDRLTLGECAKTSYQVTLAKRDDLYKILNNLYERSTDTTRLNRKYNKYQEFIKWYANKTDKQKII